MNALTDLFTLDRIALDNPAKSRADAFAAAGNLFAKEGSIDAAAVVGFLNAREDLGSTALGAGVAAFIKLAQAIEFAAPDGEPVSVLIFLLVPEKATQQHLEILSSIAQLLSDPGARNTLASEKETTKVYELLQQWSPGK